MDPAPRSSTSPWAFVPLLYLMQSVPVTIIQEAASAVYKDLGVPIDQIVTWTSLVALPWSMQLLLGPLVDLNGTKRKWIVSGQMLVALGLAGASLMLRSGRPFELSLAVFAMTAVASALCNIATDGFYLLSVAKDSQAKFVGVLTTCSRLGRLFCIGLVPFVVDILQKRQWPVAQAWSTSILAVTAIYAQGVLVNHLVLPHPAVDEPRATSDGNETSRTLAQTVLLVASAISGYFACNAVVRLVAELLSSYVPAWKLPSDNTVVGLRLPMPPQVVEIFQLIVCLVVFAVAASTFKRLIQGTQMGEAFTSFFKQQGIVAIFFFILLYRFGEAMVARMSPIFLKDAIANGGLGVDNGQFGLIKGVAGVIGIMLGGLAGGYVVSKLGLRKAFLPLALAMHLPNLLYLWASTHTMPLLVLHLALRDISLSLAGVEFVDQFGYGFGFAAYMVFIMQVAQRGKYRTSHYAIGTGMGALCIAIAGVISGVLQKNFGYTGFFTWVIFLSIPGLITLRFIPLNATEASS